MRPTDLILSHAELVVLTGYQRPADQVAELQRLGFTRARRSPTTGEVILERAHYLAVSAGASTPQRPKVRPPRLRSTPAVA